MIYIGLDDTDNDTSRGTGRLARAIAAELSDRFDVRGVTRHQLLVDPRIPYTSHNSSAAIHLLDDPNADLGALADKVEAFMLADFIAGSDPGLCVTRTVGPEVMAFGRRARTQLIQHSEARTLASRERCILRGLGGTQDGVIGALAAVGLASTGEDGRFILVGSARELQGIQTIETILASGVAEVRTLDGQSLKSGKVDVSSRLRPAFRGNEPVLFVTHAQEMPETWLPLKLD